VAPFAGVWADRTSRYRLVIATQCAAMLQALVLAALVLSDRITIPWVLALSAFLAVVSGVDVPSRQTFLVEMIDDREDLPNAIALNSSAFNLSRLIGPSIGGFLIAAFGEGFVFLVNGLSYVAVIAALMAMRVPRHEPSPGQPQVLRNLQEGFRYAFGFAPIRALILLIAGVSLLGVPFTVLFPVVATQVLGGGPHTLGLLAGSMGLGALSAAMYLAGRPSVRGLGGVIRAGGALFGVALLALAAARQPAPAFAATFAAGAGVMLMFAAANTILQTILEDDKRGRVLSLYATAFLGMVPLGSLFAGALANRLGAPITIAMGGAGVLATTALFSRALPALRQDVRPIYERLGIAPAAGPTPPGAPPPRVG
jgi:MFS family permease